MSRLVIGIKQRNKYMKLPDQIRSLFAVLLKNGLISVGEIAMFQVHREEDKKQMLEIVKKLYENRIVHCSGLEVILMTEDDVFMLIDYIVDDSISVKVNDTDNRNGIKIEPGPHYPQNPITIMPLTYPCQPGNNCYCVTTSTVR